MNAGLINLAKKHNCALLYYPGGSNQYKNLNTINNTILYIVYSECYQYISTMTPNMQPLILIEIFDTNEWKIPFGYKKLYEIFLESKHLSQIDLSQIDEFLINNIRIYKEEKYSILHKLFTECNCNIS